MANAMAMAMAIAEGLWWLSLIDGSEKIEVLRQGDLYIQVSDKGSIAGTYTIIYAGIEIKPQSVKWTHLSAQVTH